MKTLFIMRHVGFTRNFESVLVELARRGHSVHVAFEQRERSAESLVIERLARDNPTLTYGWTPRRDREAHYWADLATGFRESLDYLFYLDPRYDNAPKLRA